MSEVATATQHMAYRWCLHRSPPRSWCNSSPERLRRCRCTPPGDIPWDVKNRGRKVFLVCGQIMLDRRPLHSQRTSRRRSQAWDTRPQNGSRKHIICPQEDHGTADMHHSCWCTERYLPPEHPSRPRFPTTTISLLHTPESISYLAPSTVGKSDCPGARRTRQAVFGPVSAGGESCRTLSAVLAVREQRRACCWECFCWGMGQRYIVA